MITKPALKQFFENTYHFNRKNVYDREAPNLDNKFKNIEDNIKHFTIDNMFGVNLPVSAKREIEMMSDYDKACEL